MGYTHSWTFKAAPKGAAELTEARYKKAMLECQKIVKRYYAEHGGLSGYSAHSKLGRYGGLEVNGKGDDAHESFVMREHYNENKGFSFCKTARKPYDLVVVACLALLKHRLGELIDVSSDGDSFSMHDGVNYARKVTRLAIKNPIGDRSKAA